MTFADVTSLADLLVAVRAAKPADKASRDPITVLEAVGECDRIAHEHGHLDHHHVLSRLSASSPTALAYAELANVHLDPAFVGAAARALDHRITN